MRMYLSRGLPCVRYGELYTRYHNYILSVASRIPPSVALTALPIRTGALLFAGSGETAEEIGELRRVSWQRASIRRWGHCRFDTVGAETPFTLVT